MASLLAGYISGYSVDLARVIESKGGGVRLVGRQSYQSREFSNFDSILKLHLRKSRSEFSVACFGVAGPVINQTVATTNLPWRITSADLRREYGFRKVKLVNDLVATAQGLAHLKPSRFFTINKGAGATEGNMGLISAGVGLGEALIYADIDYDFDSDADRHNIHNRTLEVIAGACWACLVGNRDIFTSNADKARTGRAVRKNGKDKTAKNKVSCISTMVVWLLKSAFEKVPDADEPCDKVRFWMLKNLLNSPYLCDGSGFHNRYVRGQRDSFCVIVRHMYYLQMVFGINLTQKRAHLRPGFCIQG